MLLMQGQPLSSIQLKGWARMRAQKSFTSLKFYARRRCVRERARSVRPSTVLKGRWLLRGKSPPRSSTKNRSESSSTTWISLLRREKCKQQKRTLPSWPMRSRWVISSLNKRAQAITTPNYPEITTSCKTLSPRVQQTRLHKGVTPVKT